MLNNNQECGGAPYVANVMRAAASNQYYRKEFWTGEYLQMTVMNIPACGDIGLEIHEDTDQMIFVESGSCTVMAGRCEGEFDYCQDACCGDVIMIPAGMWHNILNKGNYPLKLASIYGPPHHKRGTVHCTKKDAYKDEH